MQHFKVSSLFWYFSNIHCKETLKYNIHTAVAKMAQNHMQDKVCYD